jgi:hypothetical protein
MQQRGYKYDSPTLLPPIVVGELVLLAWEPESKPCPLTSGRTQGKWVFSCTSPGQHSGAGPDGKGTGKPAPREWEQEHCPTPLKAAAHRRVGPTPWMGSTVELAPEAQVQVSQSQGCESRRVTLPPADGSFQWPSWSSAGELILVIWLRESLHADQLSYHPCTDPGLWVGPTQNLNNLKMFRMCERSRPADPKLQDLPDTEQQQDNQEESWWGANLDGIIESRDLGPDQTSNSLEWTFASEMCGQRDTLWDTLWHITASTMRCFLCFACFLFVYVLFCGEGCQGKGQTWGDGEMSRTGVHDVKLTKNKKLKTKHNNNKTKPTKQNKSPKLLKYKITEN